MEFNFLTTQQLDEILLKVTKPLEEKLEANTRAFNELTEEFLTTNELAEIVKLTPKTIREKAIKGELPHYLIAGERRFKLSEINKLRVNEKANIN